MAAVGLREYFTYHGLIWCLLVLFIRETASTCDVKFADGLGKNDKRIFVLGERAELKCDVTAMDPTQDVLYWKYDEKVFSENEKVMPLYKNRYKVSLGMVNGKKIYTLSFKVEADDVGKYNCTCGSGGIQYPVWVKVPCNDPPHVVNETDVTSQEIIDYLGSNRKTIPPAIKIGQTVTFNLGLDCKCTWPEVNRTFNGTWKNKTEPYCSEYSPDIPVEIGYQNSSVKPLSCYTGVGSVTFRYKDVIGSFESFSFTCNASMSGQKYVFYIDEGQENTPDPLLEVECEVCEDTDRSATTKVCIIVGIIIGICGLFLIVATILIRLPPDKDMAQKTQTQTVAKATKKVPWKKIVVTIVSITVIIVGACCLIALIVQTVRDRDCKIPSSRKCACSKCEYFLSKEDTARAVIVGVITFAVMLWATGYLVYMCISKPLTKVSPQTTSQQNQTNYPKTILQKQANPQLNQANYPETISQKQANLQQNQVKHREKIPAQKQVNLNLNPTQVTHTSEEEINSSRKKHNVLKERGVKKDDAGRSGDDQGSTIPNGFPVPVSGSTAGQLSEMTPEKHPPPKLDPIITVPEGGEAVTDENTDTPRERKKKRRKKHRNKVSPEGGADPDAGDSLAPDPLVVERNEVFVPVVDLDHANHNETSDV